ncbi:ribonuclease P protein component [Paenibacillus crassostreae]|uniref:Ribonuclease P protein component n=1 Tax=Paenibacillus crassostreae TaxID=1763538 RepID=A0A162L5N0_9BACL|nr:ribonuclease P protein component [Paenibacillus crassostreae]AOZ92855.1 ribonuclease P protein component [Paenibacillus crassostreae]OAB72055.1 ribonuclease P protein component [Paenibacillus crassostreae]
MQKRLRLRNRADFSRVYRHGKSFANRQFVTYWFTKKEVEQFRVGISVSKKVGNAVVRNRLRRMVKEIVRHHQSELIEHIDLVFIVRNGALDMPYKDMEKSILHVLRKASLLKSCKR